MRIHRNAIADNARWAGFEPRTDDIFVCTPSKCGTTWMQTIVANLLWSDGDIPAPVFDISPWIEAKFGPAEPMHQMLRAQRHRRFVKSHSPADAIPWFPQAKYITVGRDGRDAFMSWCNHVQRMKMTGFLNERAAKEGLPELPTFDGDFRSYFYQWLAMDDMLFTVVSTFWARRNEPNLMFVHYNDLKTDLEGEMRRVAAFLGIDIAQAKWPAVVQRCTFESMRKTDRGIGDFNFAFEGGIEGFLFKGTNGRWRDVLTEADLAAYQRRVAEMLPPEAAQWLEHGRRGTSGKV